MKIKIGKCDVTLEPIDTERDAIFRKFFKAKHQDFLVGPQLIYQWDCAKGKGKKDPRPETVTIDGDCRILLNPAWLRALNLPGPVLRYERDLLRRILIGCGFRKVSSLQDAINKLFPPLKAKIPYDKLIDPFKEKYSIDLHLQEHYLRWDAIFSRDGKVIGAVYLQFPIAYVISSKVTGVCKGSRADALFDQNWVKGRVPLGDWGKEMIEEYAKQTAKAEAKAKELKSQLKKWKKEDKKEDE